MNEKTNVSFTIFTVFYDEATWVEFYTQLLSNCIHYTLPYKFGSVQL